MVKIYEAGKVVEAYDGEFVPSKGDVVVLGGKGLATRYRVTERGIEVQADTREAEPYVVVQKEADGDERKEHHVH